MKTTSQDLADGGTVSASQWFDGDKHYLALITHVRYANIQIYPTPAELRAIAAKLIQAADEYEADEANRSAHPITEEIL